MSSPAIRPVAAVTAFVATAVAIGCSIAAPTPFGARWSQDPQWDDGLAEVARYDAERPIYGSDRPYTLVLLTVKEELDANTAIKADPPLAGRELITVLKQNAVREIGTPNYDYRIMTSVFVRRDDPSRAVKLSATSHEWCGNTWQRVRVDGGRATHDWSSYFEGEGDGSERLAVGDGALFADQLPLALRGLPFDDGFEGAITLLVPSLARSHAGPLEKRRARVRVTGRETLVLPGGPREAWRVEIDGDGVGSRWWFAVDGTHALLRMESDDGERMTLRSIERRAYWRLP